MVVRGELVQGALLLLEVLPVVHGVVVVDEAVDSDNLRGVGEKRGVDLEA